MIKDFISFDEEHQISLNIDNDESWFEINKFNFEFYKTFLLLFKEVFDFMIKNNIKIVKQYINEEDKKYFESSTFIEYNSNIIIAYTPLDKFTCDIMNALGIKLN